MTQLTQDKYLEFIDSINLHKNVSPQVTQFFADPIYLAMGMADEAGEVLGKLKKVTRDFEKNYNDDFLNFDDKEFKRQMLDEMSDVMWYLGNLLTHFDSNFDDLMKINYDKLSGRLSRGTIQGSGDDR